MEVNNEGAGTSGTSINSHLDSYDSLHLKLKSLVLQIDKYLNLRTEDSALLIIKHLQALSMTIDVNIFDPKSPLGNKLYIGLYNLFTNIEPQSQMSWYCVDTISNACNNSSARQTLIHTYNFIPSLSRLLCDQLTCVKKKKLLKLIQDLSCGIKISWQIPHLPDLIATLTKWVESQDEEIICLSLGVLVNLCYKNLPAVYTLSKTVDVKKFLRFCLPFKGPIIEVHVCKLLMILDYMNLNIDKFELVLEKVITATFLSILEAFKNNDAILLRQSADFFLDVVNRNGNDRILEVYKKYEEDLTNLLQLADNSVSTSGDSGCSNNSNTPECISIVLEFIHSLMVQDLISASNLPLMITRLATGWVNSDWVSFQALIILTKIVDNLPEVEARTFRVGSSGRSREVEETDKKISQILISALPSFLLTWQTSVASSNVESCRRLGALLQLFRGMLQVPELRPSVCEMLTENLIAEVFIPLQTDNYVPILKSSSDGICTTDTVNTCLYAVSLVNDLAQHNSSWLGFLCTLMENKRVHMSIAQAMLKKKIATAMHTLQSLSSTKANKAPVPVETYCPVIPFAQMERLDDTLKQIKEDQNGVSSTSASQVMELYEYKIGRLAYEEKSALNNLEAATEQRRQLQNRLALITAEQNKMQQLLLRQEHNSEQASKLKEEFRNLYVKEQDEAKDALGKIKVYERILKTKDTALEHTQTRANELSKQIEELSDTLLKQRETLVTKEGIIKKLVDSGNKSEKNLRWVEENLKKTNLDNKNLNSQIVNIEEKLGLRDIQLAELKEQYQAAKNIIDTITKVAMRQDP
ncbi:hypothetical protein NQ315_009515 [Exocentrus adspersus]|uniref:CIP2A N-terminal domain-containing protein n=1 Tax=Exocentrus adspersus TaxID=1586481 RepID=A0AAV8WHS1_9CUCU|nr:hypothetical protein NQ315_009515 [Exocentrus adspersus]